MAGLMQVDFGPPKPQEDKDKQRAVGDALGQMLAGKFNEWKDAKRDVETEWLKDIRAYNGIYEPEILARLGKNRSKIFIHLTRTKTQTAYARLIDLQFQTDDPHWAVEPTPIPTVSPEAQRQMAKQVYLATGQVPTAEELKTMANLLAESAAEKMTLAMRDQKAECGYDETLKTAMLEMCMLGTGAVKGFFTRIRDVVGWTKQQNEWNVSSESTPVPDCEAVSVFDLYPDPYAITMEDATGIFQRHILTRSQLDALSVHAGFSKDTVTKILTEFEGGNHTQLDHEIERRKIAGYNTTTSKSGRYEVLEYWGTVTGRELESAGLPEMDPAKDYQANVWTCAGYTIKAQLNPFKPVRLPYHIAPYERVPHQFWGVGVPRQMRDSQTTMNTSARIALDNLGISSGPQVEVNMDLVDPLETVDELFPWKIWKRSGGDPQAQLLRFYQPDNIITHLVNMMEIFRRFADEETNLPSYTHGEQTQSMNSTASGMSMLMGAAAVVTNSTIKNSDEYLIRPLNESQYHWNMQWNPDESIKGDMNVVARGSTALIAKETQSQRLIQFAGMTTNPVDMQFVDRPALLKAIAESMDLDAKKIIPYDPEQTQQFQGAVGAGSPGGVAPEQQQPVEQGMGGVQGVSVPPPQPLPG